jgi:uncharacterized protein YjbI with pentapeptide repeats
MHPRRQSIPEKYLELFTSADPGKDAQRFWAALTEVYQDSDGNWRADWQGFVFPDAVTSFGLGRFAGQANFTGVTFLGRAAFSGAVFEEAAFFTGAKFLGGAHLYGSTLFMRYADFSEALFLDKALFDRVMFSGATSFRGAKFEVPADFRGVTFGSGLAERLGPVRLTSFVPLHRFGLNLSEATFLNKANFEEASMTGDVLCHRTSFRGPATFVGARLHSLSLVNAFIEDELILGLDVPSDGRVLISQVGSTLESKSAVSAGPARIRFGRMSLATVELRSLTADQTAELRFRDASSIEKLALVDVEWPGRQSGYRVADEIDLERASQSRPHRGPGTVRRMTPQVAPTRDASRSPLSRGSARSHTGSALASPGPSVQEVERIYRSLRKNYEDRNDRVTAHRWYFSEMDVGRRFAYRRFTRIARWFYWLTSSYGLSPVRPVIWLLAISAFVFGLFMVPSVSTCPVVEGSINCGGWAASLTTVLYAVTFQSVPEGFRLEGIVASAAWILARVGGAAMLLSIGVAFRNQIAR